MIFARVLLFAFLVLALVHASNATVRISDDRGGQIGQYLDRFNAIRASGESVVIDGECLSACTMVLGIVPQDKICVTSRASLGFHNAYNLKAGARVANAEATELLYSNYSKPVKTWITAHGGLKSRIVVLRGKELLSMYRPCYLNAQGSVHHQRHLPVKTRHRLLTNYIGKGAWKLALFNHDVAASPRMATLGPPERFQR
jgi:hypothetical protein